MPFGFRPGRLFDRCFIFIYFYISSTAGKIPGEEGGPVFWMTFVDSEKAFEIVPKEVV